MNYTPRQLEALNRAIAEHCGWKYRGEINGRSVWQEREDTSCVPPTYTTDLNAIVEVVQEWSRDPVRLFEIFFCNTSDPSKIFMAKIYTPSDCIAFAHSEHPALALCIAFAKAAGLKGDWNE